MPKNIIVVSSPRSGNTWLGRLLGDALDSPLLAWERDGIDDPEYFGRGRNGGYLIRKSHSCAEDAKWGKNIPTIFIQRDPRDMILSRIFYRGQKPTEKVIIGTIRQSVDLRPPLVYPNYIDHWIADPRLTYHTKYETLHKLKGQEIKNILGACGIMISPQRANAVWDYQLFSKVKSRYPGRFEGSMRKGVVGDWKNYYTRNCCEEITKIMGEFMLRQGYIKGLAWWKEFPDG